MSSRLSRGHASSPRRAALWMTPSSAEHKTCAVIASLFRAASMIGRNDKRISSKIFPLERVVDSLHLFRIGQVKQTPMRGRVVSMNGDQVVHQ